jgi:hypothetical protein
MGKNTYDEKYKEYQKQWRAKNKDKVKKWRKEYNERNPGNEKKFSAEWRKRNPTYMEQWRKENKEYNSEWVKIRRNADPLFKLKYDIRESIRRSFKKKKFNKNSPTQNILGCTIEEFKQHIESQFEPWMNWNNRGSRKVTSFNQGWDIDHIIPISSAKTEEDVIRLNHYTNLRPLCSYYNRFVKRNHV